MICTCAYQLFLYLFPLSLTLYLSFFIFLFFQKNNNNVLGTLRVIAHIYFFVKSPRTVKMHRLVTFKSNKKKS